MLNILLCEWLYLNQWGSSQHVKLDTYISLFRIRAKHFFFFSEECDLLGDIPEEKKQHVGLSIKLLAPFCLLNRHEFTQVR